jgi:hypothetical protein
MKRRSRILSGILAASAALLALAPVSSVFAQKPGETKMKPMPVATPKSSAPTSKMSGGTKKMPARDPKTGKFIKAGTTTAGSTGTMKASMGAKEVKKMPARDPKTGRFISGSAEGKKTPARDPKTGRFIKGEKKP